MSIGMTVAFIVDVSALSIVFTALYVIVFGVTLGPLVWCVVAVHWHQWLCNLIVGVSYPYISDALDDYAYVPFVVLLAIFYLLSLKLVPETSGKSPRRSRPKEGGVALEQFQQLENAFAVES
ncbi:Major facilitator, sugar transporter-like [Phytophthora cactorum]|nr:Major facilitator, sugar transporter-like [Phytophthora cactorum]